MRTSIGLFLFVCVLDASAFASSSAGRKILTDTIAQTSLNGPPHQTGTVVRQLLTPAETAVAQSAHFVLAMRNLDELQARVQRGEVLTLGEMASRYLPTHETWAKVADWARSQGLTVAAEDTSRMTVFASSSVTQVETALQMRFARVIGTDGLEYTSAITPPAIPAELGGLVVGILKLQPHLRPIRKTITTPVAIGGGYITPTTIAQLYNATGLTQSGTGLDGTGQTIVILGQSQVATSDLTTFWSRCSLSTTLSQFQEIDPDPANLGSNANAMEESMDIEWSSAMAPKAKIIYLSTVDAQVLASWLFARQATDQSIHQVNESFGLTEILTSPYTITSQYYAAMAAVGVTFFAATGDYGSTAGLTTTYYDPNGVTAPGYPASDPYVTAVGGTNVSFVIGTATSPRLPVTEGGWCLPTNQPLSADSGKGTSTGGISGLFSRPVWQTGANLPAGSRRCVPDVAAMAMGDYPGAIVFQGTTQGGGGTSQSSPIWTGLCALINQARATAGLSPVGLLGPKVYPLYGTAAFNQITTGSSNGMDAFTTSANNGAYTVGANYNLVTGLGSPNMSRLITALTTATGTAPVITTQPTAQVVAEGGTVTFSVAASGAPSPSFQWSINGAAVSEGSQPDHSIASGSATSTLTISNAQTTGPVVAIATNANGTATSTAVTMTVTLPTPPTAAVTTLAGSLASGSADGTGTAARFNSPGDIAIDSSGTLYVADSANDLIRKITPAGVVTTLAGSGAAGSTDASGTLASFNNPTGLAVDAAGYVYVADQNNNKIRKITPAGVVTTLAGSGAAGSTNATGTAASFNNPTGPAVDAAGNVYVADQGNNTIRKVSAAGVVTTLAGSGVMGLTDGTGTAASFYAPACVEVDAAGYVYVADGTSEIRKISPAGVVTTLAGMLANGSTDGSGALAGFGGPGGVTVDIFGNLYVADAGANEIRKVSPTGLVITLAGSLNAGSANGSGAGAGFNEPQGVAVDAAGNIYVADFGNNEIRKITQIPQAVPVITWAAPAAIDTATPLSSAQLNATANVPGTFAYSPAAGALLAAGTQTLHVTFTPTDPTSYAGATATQVVTVLSGANQSYLQQIFPLVLNRTVDSGALSAYLAAMSGGLTRSQVYANLIASTEFANRQIDPAIRLYYAALARLPDYAGLWNWSNALSAGVLTLTGAADQFAVSPEFTLKYGNLDNTGYVQQLYRNVLGREADPAGLADWVGQLDGGASRGTILVGFSESTEFKNNLSDQVEILRLFFLLKQSMPTATQMQTWIEFLKGYGQTETLLAQAALPIATNADYVQAVFHGFLRRDADAGALSTFGDALAAGTISHGGLVETVMDSTEFNLFVAPVARLYISALLRVPDEAGFDNWVAYVRAGNSLQMTADAFAGSAEFTNRYGAMSNTDYVTALYENILGREPDPAGLADWVGQLGAGTATRSQILIGFAQSQEAMHLFAPTVRTFLHYFTFAGTAPTQVQLDYWANYLATLTDQMRQTFLDNL